jgi:hypothetical protein
MKLCYYTLTRLRVPLIGTEGPIATKPALRYTEALGSVVLEPPTVSQVFPKTLGRRP